MHAPRRSALAIASLALVAAAGGPAAAQNLLVNPGFDTGLAGWTIVVGSGTTAWSPLDAAAQPGSGSLRLVADSSLANDTILLAQCLPVQGGARYDGAADFFIPSGQSRSGLGYLTVAFARGPDCSSFITGSDAFPVATPGGWQRSGARFTAPLDATKALVAVVGRKYDPGGTLTVHADNAVFGRVGTVAGCIPDPTTLCLRGGRFRVVARWQLATSEVGDGRAVRLTDETGYFWFFGPANVEVLVKVIDACVAPFDRFWVFAAGLTNVLVQLEVTDTFTDTVRQYENPQGQGFSPILDTSAFATCP